MVHRLMKNHFPENVQSTIGMSAQPLRKETAVLVNVHLLVQSMLLQVRLLTQRIPLYKMKMEIDDPSSYICGIQLVRSSIAL